MTENSNDLAERIEGLKAWIAALRSGEYTQGSGLLVQESNGKLEHCCLGVACEVAGLKRSKLGSNLAYEYELCEKDEICHESWGLPESLKAKQTYPLILSYEPILTAINANDSRLLTFTEIADVLESVYLGDGTKAEKILVTMYKKKKNWVMEDSIKGKMRKGFASLKADFERASIY